MRMPMTLASHAALPSRINSFTPFGPVRFAARLPTDVSGVFVFCVGYIPHCEDLVTGQVLRRSVI